MTDTTSPVVPAASTPAVEQPNTQSQSQVPEGQQDPTQQTQDERPRKTADQRIGQLTARYREAERRAQEAESRLAAQERERAQATQFAEIDSSEPQIDRFNTLAEYQRAYGEWTVKKATAKAHSEWEKRMEQQQAVYAQQEAQRVQAFQRLAQENQQLEEGMKEGVKKYPDFADVVGNPDLPSVRGTPLFDIVMAAQNRADIAYALAKKPGELDRLLSMPPARAAMEVFRLDAQFKGNGATSAPPPPPQRNGSAAVVKDFGSMSTAEHVEAYRRQKRSGSR